MHGNLKSAGERTIADFLTNAGIRYNYEPAVMINDGGYNRIWYPDFGLPEYSVFIEYFGMVDDHAYDKQTDYKLATYGRNSIDVIPVYPSTLAGNYQRYLFGEIYRTTNNRLLSLEEKIFKYEKFNPGYSQNRTRHYSKPSRGYRRGRKY